MTLEVIRGMLGWCIVMDVVILWIWLASFVFAHGWMHRMHGKWFKMSVETFDAVHYGGMAALKIGMILFHLVPYLALRIVG
jgi:hypothetical protein